jgi:hypothetical protein
VDEDYGLVLRKDDVRAAGKVLYMEPKSKPQPVEQRADPHLGFRVLSPNAAHIPGATFFREPVLASRRFPILRLHSVPRRNTIAYSSGECRSENQFVDFNKVAVPGNLPIGLRTENPGGCIQFDETRDVLQFRLPDLCIRRTAQLFQLI